MAMQKNTHKELPQPWAPGKAHPHLVDSLIFLLMATLAFTIYSPSIKGPFIFDDKPNILYSPAVRMTEFSFTALEKAAFDGEMPSRPIANISFALNYLVSQYDVAGFHTVNILIHAITGFILYLLFRITLQIIDSSKEKKPPDGLPLAAALIWLVHPAQSQSVAYIVQRMTSLSAMFYLLAMLLYTHGRLTSRHKQRLMLFSGSILAGLLALASKEIAATLPLFIFLYEWYFFQDLNSGWLKKRLPYIGLAAGSFILIALVFLGTDPLGSILSSYQAYDFNLPQRVLTELRVVIFYMGQLLLPNPAGLCLEHDIPLSYSLLTPITTLFSAIFLIAFFGGAIRLAKDARLVSFALLWYLGNLLIESSVIGLDIIFEHRNYLPSTFFILLTVVLGKKFLKPVRANLGLTIIVITLLSFLTYNRSTVWANDETLIRDCIKKAPNKFRMYYNLGTLLYKKGDYDGASTIYRQALQVYPKDHSAWGGGAATSNLGNLYTNLGNALSSAGKYAEGDNAYYHALENNREDARAYLGLGNNSMRQGNYNGAKSYYHRGLLAGKNPEINGLIERGLGVIMQEQRASRKP